MVKKVIDAIVNLLVQDRGISGPVDQQDHIYWLIFLKYLDEKLSISEIQNEKPSFSIRSEYRWKEWGGKERYSPHDLKEFIDNQLFPYFQNFINKYEQGSTGYKIGEIFGYFRNKIESGSIIKEIIERVDELDITSDKSHEIINYLEEENLSRFSNHPISIPSAVARTIIKVLNPLPEDLVYDGNANGGNFMMEAYLKKKENSPDRNNKIENTIFGNEIDKRRYIIGLINLMISGISDPKLWLDKSAQEIESDQQYDIIASFPPFGSFNAERFRQQKIFSSYPFSSNKYDVLYLRHYMDLLSDTGRAAVILPQGVLFNVSKNYVEIRKQLLQEYNLHTILSLPAGTLPFTLLKTAVLFFDRLTPSSSIFYYECTLDNPKKQKVNISQLKEFEELFHKRTSNGRNAWLKEKSEISETNLNPYNPYIENDKQISSPQELVDEFKNNIDKIRVLYKDLNKSLNKILNQSFSFPDEKLEISKLSDVAHSFKTGKLHINNTKELLKLNDIDEFGNILIQSPSDTDSIDEDTIKKGGILFCNMGSDTRIGQSIYIKEDLHIQPGSAFTLFYPKEDIILSKYLVYYLSYLKQKDFFDTHTRASSSGQSRISISQLKETIIAYPSLKEQQKIVNALDKVFDNAQAMIKECTRSIENLTNMQKSFLKDIFDQKKP